MNARCNGQHPSGGFRFPLYDLNEACFTVIIQEDGWPLQSENLSGAKSFIKNDRCAITPRLRASVQVFRRFILAENTITLVFSRR